MAQKFQISAPAWQDVDATIQGIVFQLNANRGRAIATVLGVSAVAFAIPPCYANYKKYLSVCPGAFPSNPIGWALNWMLKLLSRETTSTTEYEEPWRDRYGKGLSGKEADVNRTSYLSDLPQQARPRPEVAPFIVPQRLVHPVMDPKIIKLETDLLDAIAEENKDLIGIGISKLEGHYPALYVKEPTPIPRPAQPHKREIGHVHVGGDNSAHCTVSYADAKQVIEKGWGERHPLDGTSLLGCGYLMIYPPRTEEEVEVLGKILRASVQFNTSLA